MEPQFSQGPASRECPAPPPPPAGLARSMRLAGLVLRAAAVLLTFVAAIVMWTANQTKTLAVGTVPFDHELKAGKTSALVNFIVINVIVFVYSALALAISIAWGASASALDLPFSISDVTFTALLFSCNSAAGAVNAIAENGNTNLMWGKVCNVFGSFCAHVTASIVLSTLASVAYFLLVVLALIGYKRSQ